MNYKEFKNICIKLENSNCYYRHPQKDFVKVLGQETVDYMVNKGLIKDSPLRNDGFDYTVPCYEFGTLFRKVYNFVVTPLKLYLKIYIFPFYRLKYVKDRIIYKLTGKRPYYYGYNEAWAEVEDQYSTNIV